MKLHRALALMALASASCGLSAGSAHGQGPNRWTDMTVFGDSLSDTGSSLKYTTNISNALSVLGQTAFDPRPQAPYYNPGRWTNGAGVNYSQLNLAPSAFNKIWHWELADRLGISRAIGVNSIATGTNYACGGATTINTRDTITVPTPPGLPPGPTFPTVDNIGYQVNTMFGVTTATLSSKTLYAIWGGGNDIRNAILPGVLGGVLEPPAVTTGPQATALGTAASANIRASINALATRAAATNVKISVVWPNVVPMQLIPDFANAYGGTAIQRGLALAASTAFRTAWAADIAALTAAFPNNLEIFGLDYYGFFIDINNGALFPTNPALFNRTDPILNFNGFINPTFAPERNALTTVPAGASPDSYIFWDRVHPTARIHALMGEYARDRIPAPGTVAFLALGSCFAMRRRRAA